MPDLRHLRVLHQRADQHPPDRLLRRPRHRGGQRRVHPGGDRRVQPDRLRRVGLDVRPVQPARPAVLVLRAARAFAGAGPVHLVRSGQPVGVLGVLRARLGGDRARHLRADQRDVRPPRHAGDRRRGSSPRIRSAARWPRSAPARCAAWRAAICWRSWPAAWRACSRRCWCCGSPGRRRRSPPRSERLEGGLSSRARHIRMAQGSRAAAHNRRAADGSRLGAERRSAAPNQRIRHRASNSPDSRRANPSRCDPIRPHACPSLRANLHCHASRHLRANQHARSKARGRRRRQRRLQTLQRGKRVEAGTIGIALGKLPATLMYSPRSRRSCDEMAI